MGPRMRGDDGGESCGFRPTACRRAVARRRCRRGRAWLSPRHAGCPALNREQHFRLPGDALFGFCLRGRRGFLHALAQRFHQVYDVARSLDFLGFLDRDMGLFLAQEFDHGFFVAVGKRLGLEVALLGLEDVLGKLEHLACHLDVLDVVEKIVGFTHFIGVVQRGAEQSLAGRFQRDDPLALGHDDPAERDHSLALHGVANDRECLLPHQIVGGDVIGRVVEAFIDLRRRYEAVDLDRVIAFDFERVEFVVFDQQVFVLGDLVALGLVSGVDRLAGLVVDQLLAQAVAGLPVDLPERDALGGTGGRRQCDRTGDQRKLEIALPIGTRCHGGTPLQNSPAILRPLTKAVES